jgi:adenylate cyclase
MGEPNQNTRKLAAIMFTDIVGYSKLIQKDEDKALNILDEHNAIVRPILSQFNGEEIKTIGDAFLIQFDSTLHAINCAVEIQKQIISHNSVQSADKRFKIRIGIHLGDIVFKDNDVFGDGVNIASRIEPLATPGGICISDHVYLQVRRKTKLKYESIGTPELKNIEDEVEVYKVILPWNNNEVDGKSFESSKIKSNKIRGIRFSLLPLIGGIIILFLGFGFWVMNNGGSEKGNSIKKVNDSKISIAVLPFVNFSSDKENEYFSDGITEELLNYLAKIKGLRVISRTSVFTFKDRKDLELTEIGKMLEVNHILEGSVRKSNNKVRITAQLIRVSDDAHLWSETYDRELTDIFAVQDEISQTIVSTLEMDFIGHRDDSIQKKKETTFEAYNMYLQGLHFQGNRNEEDMRTALTYFKKTVREDPEFDLAYVGMASTYALLADYRYDSFDTNLPIAEKNIKKALQINPNTSEAQTAYAFIHILKGTDPTITEKYFKKAIELNPNYATAHHWYSDFLRGVKKEYKTALKFALNAQRLDPLSSIIAINLSTTYRANYQIENAKKTVERLIKIQPKFLKGYVTLAFIYRDMGEWEKAKDATQKSIELMPDDGNSWIEFGDMATAMGLKKEALDAYQKAIELMPNSPIPHEFYAFGLYMFGQEEESLNSLENAYNIVPFLPLANLVEGRFAYKKGDFKKAEESYNESQKVFKGLSEAFEMLSLFSKGVLYAENGMITEANNIINELKKFEGATGSYCLRGGIHLYLEEIEKGFSLIQEGIDKNSPYYYIKVDPLFKKFKSNPEFIKILKSYGL